MTEPHDEKATAEPPVTRPEADGEYVGETKAPSLGHKIVNLLTWCPPRCRWDPENPPKFSMGLNILFGFSGAFTVANLYYNHPILNVLASDFGVPYEKVAQIPTAMQAGYAAGLLFLCPLGDSLPRRPFTLGLVFFTATMWIGLCVTTSFATFTGISFITAVTTVTPQIMLPLVGDLAPPERRASSLSIVVSGFMLGILVARVLSGTVTNYTSWRNIYWLALGLQYLIFTLLWLFMPDYPPTNPALRSLRSYLRMLWSIVEIFFAHPVLVQACLIGFFTSAPFTSFWTTLTFLLADPPYEYSSLIIGLFALIGIAAMCVTPLYGRIIIDRLTPLWSVILGESLAMVGICLGTYTGLFTVAGPILQAFLLDLGLQTSQIANRSSIYAIAPKARNRVNTAFMVFTFCGQLTGTAVGSSLYARGGWVVSGSYSVASIGGALLMCLLRGPWEERWIGWRGGWAVFQKKLPASSTDTSDKADDELGQPGSSPGQGASNGSTIGP
ncbi:hypothetical protein N0V93_006685 [Gnomoniopsis smithogilvyi]|uniref:Major facilitator superfamily (MFS) profile domain-containing protein n=1 Tax=Gnomoniopsis smithogilvyi TaxID=1191159 RepID=A0A9W8YQ66_9PEZI|nr:hypothetical protein N0V93_006685 [Gnomoniopsis smithogilvyi]